MKKLIPILLISCVTVAQEYATTEGGKKVMLYQNGTYKVVQSESVKSKGISKTDILIGEDEFKLKKETFYIINGDENLIECKISANSSLNRYSTIGLDGLNSIIDTGNIKTMFQMKNRRTYIPKKITVFYIDKDNQWMLYIEYTAQNDYGATKDGTSYVTFDDLGNFKNILVP